MASDARKDSNKETEAEFFPASTRESGKPLTSQKSLMLGPPEDSSVRYGYNMAMKVLACAKMNEYALTEAVKPADINTLLDYAKFEKL
uniref:Uncharacterized protein n=1 Tax=Caenorhabditis japonica TaxID=281687 RepID=A0A8R1IPK6_CAEJA